MKQLLIPMFLIIILCSIVLIVYGAIFLEFFFLDKLENWLYNAMVLPFYMISLGTLHMLCKHWIKRETERIIRRGMSNIGFLKTFVYLMETNFGLFHWYFQEKQRKLYSDFKSALYRWKLIRCDKQVAFSHNNN